MKHTTFWAFPTDISESNGKSEKVDLFFRREYSKRKFVFHFFKAIFDTSSRPSRPFSGKWNCVVQMVNAIPGRHLPVLNFANYLPKPWTNRFAHVNGKQPQCLFINLSSSSSFHSAIRYFVFAKRLKSSREFRRGAMINNKNGNDSDNDNDNDIKNCHDEINFRMFTFRTSAKWTEILALGRTICVRWDSRTNATGVSAVMDTGIESILLISV